MPELIRVMVVDDDPTMCDFLVSFLERLGCEAEPVQRPRKRSGDLKRRRPPL